ncbi:MAG: LytTR family transcriptional regulator [Alistipes sp.]|nr:LytTR family transcriptional regulator [Alistipes sp.]
MRQNKQLTIILPKHLADLPVRVVGGSVRDELVVGIDTPSHASDTESPVKEYAFIWRNNGYLKVSLEDILWVEADRSYSVIHLTNGRSMVVSFNLAVIEKELPPNRFVRIRRSGIVNLTHIESLTGNSLKIGGRLLTIGREYRTAFLDRFIFLGVRRHKK